MVLMVDIKESVNTAKIYAKQLEEELLSLMNAYNIDSIRQTGVKNKIKGLYDALAEIEKAKAPPKITVEKPKITVEKPKPIKDEPVEKPSFNRAM